MNPVLLLIGRVALATLFVLSGIWKIVHFAGTSGYMAKYGLLPGDVMTVIAIVFELGGGLLVVVGWKTRLAAWAIALFTAVAAFLAHQFWNADPAQFFAQFINFFKNLAIIGGFVLLAATGPGPYSIDKA